MAVRFKPKPKPKQKSSYSVVGLDIATKTGWCRIDHEKAEYGLVSSPSYKPSDPSRYTHYEDMINTLVHLYLGCELVVIEGYSLHSKFNLGTMVEVGTLVRSVLTGGAPVLEIPPTQLKKFVTGKGNANKELVMMEVYKRWGHEVKNNDEADAVGLAYIGLAFLGHWKPTCKPQEDVIADLKKLHGPTSPKLLPLNQKKKA